MQIKKHTLPVALKSNKGGKYKGIKIYGHKKTSAAEVEMMLGSLFTKKLIYKCERWEHSSKQAKNHGKKTMLYVQKKTPSEINK